jgi:hypothetical protein
MYVTYEEGDIAVVTTKKGKKFVGIYTSAPGIDYFWHPVIEGTGGNMLTDSEVKIEVIGRAV